MIRFNTIARAFLDSTVRKPARTIGVAVTIACLITGAFISTRPVSASGAASFGTATNFTVGSTPFSVVVADFNNDGKPDMVTANNGSNNVSVRLGNGAGGFSAAVNFNAGTGPSSVAVGDFNKDGKLDLAVANTGSGNVSVLLGNGDGTFIAPLNFNVGTGPVSVAVGDFNSDGKLDIVAANSNTNNVSVLLGNGIGGFGAATNFAVGTNPFSVAVGDFNADGKLDIATANVNTNNISVLLGDGSGGFAAATNFAVDGGPRSLAVGDFNRDGKLDLAVANQTSNDVSILLGDGIGGFGAATNFGVGSNPFSVAVGDFNNDGKLDLAVPNLNSNTVSVLLGTGTGSFGAKTDFTTGTGPLSVAVGNFNGDGKLDLAVANQTDNTVSILLNTNTAVPLSPLTFLPHKEFTANTRQSQIAIADFNKDGFPDVAVISSGASSLSILLTKSDGTFAPAVTYLFNHTVQSLAVGDFNGDGNPDLVIVNFNHTVTVQLGTGTGTFGPSIDSPSPGNGLIVVADFNGDGNLDIAIPHDVGPGNPSAIGVMFGTGTGSFGASVDYSSSHSVEGLAVGDFNGDGKPDLAMADFSDNTVSILLNQGNGTFGSRTTFPAGTGPQSIAVGDFNGDGKLDLAVCDYTSNAVSILLGTGTGTFGANKVFTTGTAPFSVVAGDFNGDGKLDAATVSSQDVTVSVLLGNGTGNLGAKADFAIGGIHIFSTRIAAADFNQDGKLDIITTNENDGTISELLNTQPVATKLAITQVNGGLSPRIGVPFSVVVQSQTDNGTPIGVTADTTVTLSLHTGNGSLSGNLTGTISAGQVSVTISGVIYNFTSQEFGVSLTATATNGDPLSPGNSALFTAERPGIIYTDPAGNCSGQLPCFTTIQAAIASGLSNAVAIGAGIYAEDLNIGPSGAYALTGDVTVHDLTITGGNITMSFGTLTLTGDFTNNGAFLPSVGCDCTVNMMGSAVQTIGGSQLTTFQNLAINNPNGVMLSRDETVSRILSLTNGDLNTGSNILTMAFGSSSSGAFDVVGSVKRVGFSGGTALSFGNPFNTIKIDSGLNTSPADITVTLTKTVPTDASTGQTNSGFPNAVARTYVITPNGGSGFSATLQLHYQVSDLNGNDEATLNLWRFNSLTGNWENKSATNRDLTNHSVTSSGVTQFSPWTMNSNVVVTDVKLESFRAVQHNGGALLQWQTGFEVNNLGFNVYRQQGGERVKINPSLIAGSALLVGGSVRLESGNSYSWQDDVSDPTASYWLEDVDLNGRTEWHGPVGVDFSASSNAPITNSALLNNLSDSAARQTNAGFIREYVAGFDNNSSAPAVKGSTSAVSQPITAGRTPTKASSVSSSMQKQWQISAQPSVKIAINKTGWYHVNMTDLMAAGLRASPANLQMFVGGVEIPIRVSADSIEFYGKAIDTAASDTQIYWLTSGVGSGKRINAQASPGATNNNGPTSFQYTVERKDRTVYFSSLRNGDAENWFGSVIATQPVTNVINVHNLDANAAGQAELEIALQGVTTNNHQVTVMVNGQAIQALGFDGTDHKVAKFPLPVGSLTEGDNQITFSTQSSGDVSLVDYVRVTYAHTYTADDNSLSTTAVGMQPIKVTGFTSNQIRAIDVANSLQPIELVGTIDGDAGNYAISVDGSKGRNLMVFTADKVLRPLSITANQPSSLTTNAGGNFVVITHRDFAQSIQPLVALRQSQGYQPVVVDVEDIYDQFSYGVHSPNAVKEFLNWTYLHWPKQPQYVMLAGSATIDPRNYSGLGNLDFVPTKLIDTSNMETACDDCLVDFNNDGKPHMAIGRLPIRTASDADLVINKIIAYEQSGAPEAVVLVSDLNDGVDFNESNNQIKALVPNQLQTISIVRGQPDIDAKTALMDQLTQGQRIVNYAGHGSVDLWRGGLFSANDVQVLANHRPSPLVVTMTCLNGYFQDPHLASLGESLLRVKQGGAVSVWASSGMAGTTDQTIMNREFFKQLFGSTTITLGDAIKSAKAAVKDDDVRKTWILFGDPTMRIKQ